jgi:hypothetical protein
MSVRVSVEVRSSLTRDLLDRLREGEDSVRFSRRQIDWIAKLWIHKRERERERSQLSAQGKRMEGRKDPRFPASLLEDPAAHPARSAHPSSPPSSPRSPPEDPHPPRPLPYPHPRSFSRSCSFRRRWVVRKRLRLGLLGRTRVEKSQRRLWIRRGRGRWLERGRSLG